MPRPKRAKVASAIATAPARVAKTSKAAPSKQPMRARKPSTNEHSEPFDDESDQVIVNVTKTATIATSEPLAHFSDDSDGLVVKATRPQRRMPWHPEPQKDVDCTMTGALPADMPNIRTPRNASRRTRNSKETPTASLTRKTPASSSAQAQVQEEPSQEEPIQEEPEKEPEKEPELEGDSSGFGDHLLSFTSIDSNSPAHGTRPPSAIKVGMTPAHESSILALTNFKRRARQPSLLRMVRPTTDTEDNEPDDFDFDKFLPDAESTPLHVNKGLPAETAGNDSGVNLSSSGSRGTKRKLSPVVQVPRSPLQYESSSDIGESQSPSSSLPEIVQSTEEEQAARRDEEPMSETMAPPMSSSDYEADEIEHVESPVGRRQRRTRGASTRAAPEAESEGEETDRPKKARGKPKGKEGQGISTAKLQALLPRRRTKATHDQDQFDIPSDDSDVDELAQRQHHPKAGMRKSAPPKAAKKTSRAVKKPVAKKNTRTYGRRASSDKENEEAGGESENTEEIHDSLDATTVKPSKLLEAIAKKFEEVDEFELDFESVSYVQTSSSPYR